MIKTKKIKVYGDRRQVRENLIKEFLNEEPGTGKKELSSKYRYDVEELSDGSIIYLKRPAPLNKGMDFEVHVENIRFNRGSRPYMPSHNNILEDLKIKKDESYEEYIKVINIINKTYNCEIIKNEEYRNIKFKCGYPIEAILKSIKWLFIEQDVTYWNWSGRAMLYSKFIDEGLI